MKIPDVTDARIVDVLETIRPVVVNNNGTLWYVAIADPRRFSFSFDPKILYRADGLVRTRTIRTLHTFGYVGFFKPSVAEVVAQLPEDLDGIVAFSVEGPDTMADVMADPAEYEAGFHVATTTLYSRRGETP